MKTHAPAEIAVARAAIEKLTLQTSHTEFEAATVLISQLLDKVSCLDSPRERSLPDLARVHSVLRVITQFHAKMRRAIEQEDSLSPEMEDSPYFDVARADQAASRAAGIAYGDQTWSDIRSLCAPFAGASLFIGLLGWSLHSVVLAVLAGVAVLPVVQIGWRVVRFHWITRRKIADRTRDLMLVTKRIQTENEEFLSAALEELRRELETILCSMEA